MTTESIAYSKNLRQGGLVDWSNVRVDCLDKGLEISIKKYQIVGSKSVGGKRGSISSFSVQARARLRRTLIEKYIPDSLCFGVTFTLPWKVDDFVPLMEEFRKCWNRFTVAFGRAYKNSGIIYRVELQERGAPHIHAIIYLSNSDLDTRTPASVGVARDTKLVLFRTDISWMWIHSVPILYGGSLDAFVRYGVDIKSIDDIGAMFRYLSDHASKRKQAQLGYKGKQWGIIGRDNFVRTSISRLPPFVSEGHYNRFMRGLRKVMRYRLHRDDWKRKPPFGSVLTPRRQKRYGDWFGNGDEFRRLWEFTKGE